MAYRLLALVVQGSTEKQSSVGAQRRVHGFAAQGQEVKKKEIIQDIKPLSGKGEQRWKGRDKVFHRERD